MEGFWIIAHESSFSVPQESRFRSAPKHRIHCQCKEALLARKGSLLVRRVPRSPHKGPVSNVPEISDSQPLKNSIYKKEKKKTGNIAG